MRRWLLALCLTLAPFARAAEIGMQALQWRWTEEDDDGRRLLEEEGPLLGLRLQGGRVVGPAGIAGRLDAFAGEVDYDGRTQLGEPVRTTTEYYGLQAEVDAERARGPALIPFAGLGARGWWRRIDNTSRFSEGYDEAWLTAYARLGLRAEAVGSGNARGYVSAAAIAPFYNRVRYGLSFGDGRDDVTVSPGRDVGMDLEAGVAWPRTRVALLYRVLPFKRSDAESVAPYEVYQPESRGTVLGVQVAVTL